MSGEAVGWVFRHSPLKGEAFVVHLAVADVVNDACGHEFWMTMPALAAKARVSRGTASRTMGKLQGLGMVELLTEGGGRGNPARWRFLMPDPAETARPAHALPTGNRASGDTETARPTTETARLEPPAPYMEPKEPNREQNMSEQQSERPQPTFDDFWSVYPRRTGKGAARAAWDKALRKVDARTIANAAWRYAHDPNLPEPQFIPHPSTWLNQERWEDGPLPARGSGPRRPAQNVDQDRGGPTGRVAAP